MSALYPYVIDYFKFVGSLRWRQGRVHFAVYVSMYTIRDVKSGWYVWLHLNTTWFLLNLSSFICSFPLSQKSDSHHPFVKHFWNCWHPAPPQRNNFVNLSALPLAVKSCFPRRHHSFFPEAPSVNLSYICNRFICQSLHFLLIPPLDLLNFVH